MKEQLYTIPVNDAFDADCECPLCYMRKTLEDNAVDYTMGPSYMEDDNRALTDEKGFCDTHIRRLYSEKNRLGLALMLKTHTDKTIKDLKSLSLSKQTASSSGLFKKNTTASPIGAYIAKLEQSCFICERVENTYQRYFNTVFHLIKKDPGFKNKIKNCKGFCTYHYGELYDGASQWLKGNELEEFLHILNDSYFTNAQRVNDDLEWFINKYDYRYDKEPWKNAKDAIPRTIIKSNHQIVE